MPFLFSFWYQPQLRSFISQFLFLGLLIYIVTTFWDTLQINLHEHHIKMGFDFLKDTAGFNIITHLISYDEQSNYARVFWVGLLNTLFVSGLGMIFATLLGFILGTARLSSNNLIRLIANVMLETIRNIPLLLQLFIWYFVVLRAAPLPTKSLSIFDTLYITNRGIYFPAPLATSFSSYYLFGCLFTLITTFVLFRGDQMICLSKGKERTFLRVIGWISAAATLTLLGVWLGTFSWDKPRLGQFNFEHGINLIPEFLALLFALSIYTAVYIGEIVRMGLLSVAKNQQEAALSLGFSKWLTLKLIIIPQSLRVILPPLTNQYLNLIKNSSLATAIAYPDLVSIFAGTALNQTGQAVEIIAMTMVVYLFISLVISNLMLIYERLARWGNA